MVNPPALVKLGLESICLTLNQESSDWKIIRGIVAKVSQEYDKTELCGWCFGQFVCASVLDWAPKHLYPL